MQFFDALIQWLCESEVNTPEIIDIARRDLGSVDETTRKALEALIEEYESHVTTE